MSDIELCPRMGEDSYKNPRDAYERIVQRRTKLCLESRKVSRVGFYGCRDCKANARYENKPSKAE